MPTYLAIAAELEAKLSEEPAGTRVASENELARAYGLSRLTARAVLDELELRHVVRRRRGSGTFVHHRYRFVVANQPTLSWSEAVRAGGGTPRAEITDLSTVDASPLEAKGVLGEGPLLFLRRTGWVNDERALCKESWLIPQSVPGLGEALPGQPSLFTALDAVYGLVPSRKTVRAELVRPPEDVRSALDLQRDAEVIYALTHTSSERLGALVEVTRCWLRTDVFRLVVELGHG